MTSRDRRDVRPGREPGSRALIGKANELQRSGAFEEAAEIYLGILRPEPDHVDALQFLGLLRHRQGRSKEGLRLIKRALRLRPDVAGLQGNAGKVMADIGLHEEAEAAYRRAIAIEPSNVVALCNLAALREELGDAVEAEALYRRSFAADPTHLPTHGKLLDLLASAGRSRDGLAFDAAVREASPRTAANLRRLTANYATLGEHEKAAATVQEFLALDPTHPVAQHLAAAISGVNVPDRASDGFLADTFDLFADKFDEQLRRLAYRGPEVVGAAARAAFPAAERSLGVLDTGCGTGLCGPHLRPLARRLAGVDLSPMMLEKAAARGDYDDLACAEIVAHLGLHRGAFDLIVAADTLVYFGALEAFAEAASHALRPAGALVVTVERAEDPVTDRFRLAPNGRYAHSRAYLLSCLEAAGLAVAAADTFEVRREAGAAVPGLVVTACKPASA